MHFSATYASFNANRPIRKDTVWKNEKFILTKNNCQINSLGVLVEYTNPYTNPNSFHVIFL